MSAHWQTRGPVRVTAGDHPPTIHDFGGFPDQLYQARYPAPGAPLLSREIVHLIETAGFPAVLDSARGLDHGAWIPLHHAYPRADVPVLQVSLPGDRSPAELVNLGVALRSLRSRGVLLVGSGGVVHNLRLARFEDRNAPVDAWALAFDNWIAERLAAHDQAAIVDYRKRAPHADRAVPTTEHFDPLFVAMGAADAAAAPDNLHVGFQHGNISMRTFWLR